MHRQNCIAVYEKMPSIAAIHVPVDLFPESLHSIIIHPLLSAFINFSYFLKALSHLDMAVLRYLV